MAQSLPLFSGSVLTATGSEASGHAVLGSTVNIELVVPTVSGTTPSVVFAVQWSDDGTNYAGFAADVFPQSR